MKRPPSWTPLLLLLQGASLPAAGAPPGPGFTLDFADEFNGAAVDTAAWDYRGEKAIQQGFSTRDNVRLQDGKLVLDLREENRGGKRFTEGGLISKRGFGYGYYETLCRLTDLPGWHASFWIASDYNEIDVFEVDSHLPTHVESNLHFWDFAKAENTLWAGGVKRPPEVNTADGYHLFGMEWTPSRVRFWVDGRLYREDYYPGPHRPCHVELTAVAMGKPDTSDIAGPAAIRFEYFRHYRKAYDPMGAGVPTVCGPDSRCYSETGAWANDTFALGATGKASRVSPDRAARSRWAPALPKAGNYEVLAWNPSCYLDYRVPFRHYFVQGITEASLEYSLKGAGKDTLVRMDPSRAGPGWVPLGVFDLPARGATVSMSAGAGAVARADALAFLPVGSVAIRADRQEPRSARPGRLPAGELRRTGHAGPRPFPIVDLRGRCLPE